MNGARSIGSAVCAVALALAVGSGQKAAPTLTVVFGGETRGYLAPCGCTKPMLGGISRRGAAIRRMQARGPVVAIENGDLTLAEGRQDEIKAETLVDALGAMRYDAISLGEHDFDLGLDALRALDGRSGSRLLCANAVDEAGLPAFAGHRVVQRKLGGVARRIAIWAAVAPGLSASGDVTLRDPRQALRAASAQSGIRILAFHGRRAEAEAIARAVGAFNLIVYAHGPDTPAPPVRVGRSTLVCAGTSGKYLGTAALDSSGAVRKVAYIALGEDVGTDLRIESIRRAYLARVSSENLLDLLPRSPLPKGDSYAGSASCGPCHAEAHRVWAASGHARAMATLKKVGQDRDPECVPCHVVGAAHEGGYVDKKAVGLAHVGCENCHGPGRRHADDPTVKPARGGADSCAPCHVPNHSPGFRYETYWKLIRH